MNDNGGQGNGRDRGGSVGNREEGNKMNDRQKGCLVLVVLFVAMWGGCYYMVFGGARTPRTVEPRKEHSAGKAYIYSQDFVRQQLRSPSTADFPFMKYNAREISDGVYRLSSYCDTQNGFGGTVRINYSCVMTYSGGRWSCSGLVVSQQ